MKNMRASVLALVLGGADVARNLLNLQVELSFFPLLLIAIGLILLVRAVMHSKA